jgi:hypothetical protein
VASGADELLELPVRHRRCVDPKAVDGDAMDRRASSLAALSASSKAARTYARRITADATVLPPAMPKTWILPRAIWDFDVSFEKRAELPP